MSFRRQEGKVQALDRHVQALELLKAALSPTTARHKRIGFLETELTK